MALPCRALPYAEVCTRLKAAAANRLPTSTPHRHRRTTHVVAPLTPFNRMLTACTTTKVEMLDDFLPRPVRQVGGRASLCGGLSALKRVKEKAWQ